MLLLLQFEGQAFVVVWSYLSVKELPNAHAIIKAIIKMSSLKYVGWLDTGDPELQCTGHH